MKHNECILQVQIVFCILWSTTCFGYCSLRGRKRTRWYPGAPGIWPDRSWWFWSRGSRPTFSSVRLRSSACISATSFIHFFQKVGEHPEHHTILPLILLLVNVTWSVRYLTNFFEASIYDICKYISITFVHKCEIPFHLHVDVIYGSLFPPFLCSPRSASEGESHANRYGFRRLVRRRGQERHIRNIPIYARCFQGSAFSWLIQHF